MLAALASAAARGDAISLLACAETRVWHFAHPELNLRCVFASVFAVFSSRNCDSRRATLYKKMLRSPFRVVFFRCFPMSVAFRIRFYGVFADSRLFAHASLDLHLYLISVHVLVRYIGGGGGDGGGGVMTSMRMRLLCCVSLVVLCFVHWWEGGGDGGISHRILR